MDVSGVVKRGGTALLIDHVDAFESSLIGGCSRSSLVTVEDVEGSAAAIDAAGIVSIQLQQPPAAVLAAADRGRSPKRRETCWQTGPLPARN
jgi:ribokinase